MNPLRTIPSLLLSTLLCLKYIVLHAAPLSEFSGDQGFQLFLQKNLEFTRKIKMDVENMRQHMCDNFQLCKEEELMLVKQNLNIFQPSLNQCLSKPFQVDVCFSQIREGLQTYHGYLFTIAQLLPSHSTQVEGLQLDTSNLSTNIQQQIEALGLNMGMVTYPKEEGQGTLLTFSSQFYQQAGGYIILANFQLFLDLAYRVLRHLIMP
uniref:Colony stimulating factor 3 n=1 Tax=Crocodylus porosus TaxID=8502 RepID=A0A7M4E3K4_CROPO